MIAQPIPRAAATPVLAAALAGALAGALTGALGAPAAAACLSAATPGAEIVEGALARVPGVGRVTWRMVDVAAGYNHHEGLVEIGWTAAGVPQRQVLFHGLHDYPPARLARSGGGLALTALYCPNGAPHCSERTGTFVFDRARGRFRAGNATARAWLDDECTG
jgi:hypothetical protein